MAGRGPIVGVQGLQREGGPGGAIPTIPRVIDTTPAFTTVRVTTNYTVGQKQRFVLCDCTNNAIQVTLPPQTVSLPEPSILPITVKKIDASTNAVTIRASSGGKIDGAASISISGQNIGVQLVFDGLNWWTLPGGNASVLTDPRTIEYVVVDSAGATLPTGLQSRLARIGYSGIIQAVTLLADQSGSVTIDIWKTTYAAYDAGSTHPVVADSITASAVPAISSSTKYTDSTLTGWTTAFNKGDILAYNVKVAAVNIKQVTVLLDVVRTG